MTGEEMRLALGKEGEEMVTWFMTQERKLFADSVVADSQSMLVNFFSVAGAEPGLSIAEAKELLSFLVVEYHHANIRRYSDQIPQKYKGTVDVL